MKILEQIDKHWKAGVLIVSIMAFGWYAQAEVTELREAKEIAIANTAALTETRAIVEALVKHQEREQLIKELQEQIAMAAFEDAGVFETVATEAEVAEEPE